MTGIVFEPYFNHLLWRMLMAKVQNESNFGIIFYIPDNGRLYGVGIPSTIISHG